MIKYEFTKKDLKKYLKIKRRKTNITFLIMGTFIYFYITYYLIFFRPIEAFLFYGIYLIILIAVIILFDELNYLINVKKNKIFGNYEINIENDKIIVKIDDNKYEYLNKNIKKIKKKKHYIIIKYKNHLSLLFMKNNLKYEDYLKINILKNL